MSGGAAEAPCHGLQVRSDAVQPASPPHPCKYHSEHCCCRCNLQMRCAVSQLAMSDLQEAGEQFLAGVLRHLPGIAAFLAASPNSYRRLAPSVWAGAFQVPLWAKSCCCTRWHTLQTGGCHATTSAR